MHDEFVGKSFPILDIYSLFGSKTNKCNLTCNWGIKEKATSVWEEKKENRKWDVSVKEEY